MKSLGCTKEEAIQIIKDDEDIDSNVKKDFDLSSEQEKIAKQYRNTHSKKKSDKKITRTRKPNEYKGEVIGFLAQKIAEFGAKNVQIANKEREIVFKNDKNVEFSITLVQHRNKK
jgi:hypothetical protein